MAPTESTQSLPPALCQWDADGVLRTGRFDDIYFSRDGAVAEKRHVFLAGCGLPQAWNGVPLFTVTELGFGTGLNFLVTWEAWRCNPGGRLHYVAVEGSPLSVAEMGEACARRPELAEVAAALARAYPEPQRGFHRLYLRAAAHEPEIALTLLCGEVQPMLRALEAEVDAWYLDGFAPDRNPAMWTPEVMAEIARLSHGGARPTRIATYTAAGDVRRGLDAAGFAIARAPGFGAKREMLCGAFRGGGASVRPPQPPWFARSRATSGAGHAAVVGAGIAGTSVAQALHRRGWRVTLIDRQPAPAMETSGNPVGVLMPRVAADDSIEGRVHAAAWRYALRMLDDLGPAVVRETCGVLQIADNDEEAARLRLIAARSILPASYLSLVEAPAATEIAGVTLRAPALFFPHGGTIAPRSLCEALAQDAAFLQAQIAQVRHTENGVDLLDGDGMVRVQADIVIFANALGARAAFPWLSLSARRGQITSVPAGAAAMELRTVISAAVTVTPAVGGHHFVGATFDWTKDLNATQPVRAHDHQRNLAYAAASVPGLFNTVDATMLDGRAALRCMTPDHLPVSGAAPDADAYGRDYAHLHHGQHWSRYPRATYVPRTFVLTGLGARGFVTAPLAAEIIASHITGEPWPIERELMNALHPARFLVRALQRRRGSVEED